VTDMFDEESPSNGVEEEAPEEESEEEPSEPLEGGEEVEAEAVEEGEASPEAEEPRYENAVNKGDFLKLDLTGWVVETGEVFDTTVEEVAREAGIWEEGRRYGPRLVVVGEGHVLRGLDARLPGIPFDEEVEVEIPPEEAFGIRNPDLVQMVPFRILRSKGVNPYVGAEVEVDGRRAVVRSIGAGRVQLDYNHPLAGRTIKYRVKVVEHLESERDKIKALIERRFVGVDPDEFTLRRTKSKLRIGIPDAVFFGENVQLAKRGLALDILRYFPDVEEVEFTESVKRV